MLEKRNDWAIRLKSLSISHFYVTGQIEWEKIELQWPFKVKKVKPNDQSEKLKTSIAVIG